MKPMKAPPASHLNGSSLAKPASPQTKAEMMQATIAQMNAMILSQPQVCGFTFTLLMLPFSFYPAIEAGLPPLSLGTEQYLQNRHPPPWI